MVVKDVVNDGVRVLDPQALVVTLEVKECEPEPVVVTEKQELLVPIDVKEGEPDTVVVKDEVKDEVRVPDSQPLVVTLEVKEGDPDKVGDSVPLKVEEDVWDTEVLKDPDTVEDKHKVGEVLMEVVVDKDPVWVPELQGEGVIVDVEHCEEETELDAETLIVSLKVGLVE